MIHRPLRGEEREGLVLTTCACARSFMYFVRISVEVKFNHSHKRRSKVPRETRVCGTPALLTLAHTTSRMISTCLYGTVQ